MAILLIDKDIVATKLQVAIGYDSVEFQTFINEAQEFDLKPLVEEDFYFDLLAKKDELTYKKLIDGGSYTFNTRSYSFQGLATVISYFSYARFVMNSSAVSTSHGMVVKTTPNSTPLTLEERKNFWYKKREEANLMMIDVVKFIERNISDFPSWNSSTSCGPNHKYASKTKVIQ
ncbi:hypothetical protein EV143_1187 [Flavobacterium chryseum]|uniref:DUF6712 family protein n=1 Tax=Flavobacterium sp. P3160 TaxID=2512113 RepID=UPI0010600279|nr:hypothetical protein [Flavobacterium sp. P3160]TDO68823.1 hypothetical protein EV143_1187 [Flavobacterium sp. P3160]